MARRLRYLPPGGGLVEITNRTIQGRYLLRPGSEFNQLLLGVLGRAQRLYGVTIHACTVMSNHYHLLLSVESTLQLARFIGYFQANLAKEAGRLYGWRGPFWHRRYQLVLVSDEEAAQVERLCYLFANGCKEGLVARPTDWPGVHSADALLTGEPLQGRWVDRTRELLARVQGKGEDPSAFWEVETVILSPLPCWSHLGEADYRTRVAEIIHGIELETADRLREADTHSMGKETILRQDPLSRPAKVKRSPAPAFHCVTRAARQALWEAYTSFASAFRHAAARLRLGHLDVVFPEGAFQPPAPYGQLIRAPG